MSDYQGFLLSKWKWQRKCLQFLTNNITLIVCMVLRRVYSCVSKIGSEGPDSIGSHYNYQGHDGQVTLSSGIQLWTVPRNGEYRIEAIGASAFLFSEAPLRISKVQLSFPFSFSKSNTFIYCSPPICQYAYASLHLYFSCPDKLFFLVIDYPMIFLNKLPKIEKCT